VYRTRKTSTRTRLASRNNSPGRALFVDNPDNTPSPSPLIPVRLRSPALLRPRTPDHPFHPTQPSVNCSSLSMNLPTHPTNRLPSSQVSHICKTQLMPLINHRQPRHPLSRLYPMPLTTHSTHLQVSFIKHLFQDPHFLLISSSPTLSMTEHTTFPHTPTTPWCTSILPQQSHTVRKTFTRN